MDKPARLAVAAVQTRAEQPEAPPFLVLDSVIVADRFYGAEALRSPPFVGDPLRPIGPRDPMPASPPRETKRRIVGQKPKSFDRLRRLEQSDRPRRFVRGLRNGSAGVDATDRHPDRGALRDVALARFEPRQRGEPQPIAEPVEKRSDAARLIAGGVAGEADLLGGQGLDRKGGEDHVFDTETRINSVEPLFEEGYQVVRIAARTSGAEADPLDPAVDTIKDEIEPPRSRPFPHQARNEIADQPQADPSQTLSGSRIEAERLHWQWGEGDATTFRRQDDGALALRKVNRRPGGAERVGDGDAGCDMPAIEPSH